MPEYFDLIKATDTYMTSRLPISMPRKSSWYPSEASVAWTDSHGEKRVSGGCARAAFFRYTGMFSQQALPTDAYSEWIFALGKAVEEILVERWKRMGIWVCNNLEFYDAARGISGEIDCVLRDPQGELLGTEVKSFYSYYATKNICGNKSTKGQPKTSQLLQTLVYVDQFAGQLDYFKMIYYARDSAARAQFDIRLVEDASSGVVVHRPTINGVIDYRFTMEDIYSRYAQLAAAAQTGTIPPPDYELAYSAEKIERRNLLGEVAKTTYADWKKNPEKNPIGDWNCSYCKYKELCWGKLKGLLETLPA